MSLRIFLVSAVLTVSLVACDVVPSEVDTPTAKEYVEKLTYIRECPPRPMLCIGCCAKRR